MSTKDQRKTLKRGGVFLILVLGGLGLAAFIMALVFNAQQNSATAGLNTRDSVIQQQITILQTQVLEMMMDQVNGTLVQNGTFRWSCNVLGFSPVFQNCLTGTTAVAYSTVSAGTGYNVGDLITGNDASGVTYQSPPQLRVTQVDGAGAVLAFDTLNTGCYTSGSGTITTNSPVGVGFTMQITGGTRSLGFPDSYYAYPSPPTKSMCAAQESTYELRQLTMGSAYFTVLFLTPPRYPMQINMNGPSDRVPTTRARNGIHHCRHKLGACSVTTQLCRLFVDR